MTKLNLNAITGDNSSHNGQDNMKKNKTNAVFDTNQQDDTIGENIGQESEKKQTDSDILIPNNAIEDISDTEIQTPSLQKETPEKKEEKAEENIIGISLQNLIEKVEEPKTVIEKKEEPKTVIEKKEEPEELFLNYKTEMDSIDFNPKTLLEKKIKPLESKKFSKIAIMLSSIVIISILASASYIFIKNPEIFKYTKTSVIDEVIPPKKIEEPKIEEQTTEFFGYKYNYNKVISPAGEVSYVFEDTKFSKIDELENFLQRKAKFQREQDLPEMIKRKIIETYTN